MSSAHPSADRPPSHQARADDLRAERIPFVLATVVRAERPTSAKPGDRAIVLGDGAIEGFVGGACAESTVRMQSLLLLETGESVLLRITPAGGRPSEAAPGLVVVDNTCLSGGTLDIFLEAVMPPALVHVVGETPIARALADVGRAAGYEMRVGVDPKASIPADVAAVVVASHGHGEDEALRGALAAGVPYVALIASPKRGAAVLAELGLPTDVVARVKTPAGIDIGAHTPGDIALSILAEFVQTRRTSTAAGNTMQIGGRMTAELAVAVDPVCGMAVPVTPTALSLEHGGRTWYFCCPGCRKAFAADPARYGG